MRQILQYLEPLLDDGMGFFPLDVRNKADATGIVFVRGIVKPLGNGRISHVLPLGKKSRRREPAASGHWDCGDFGETGQIYSLKRWTSRA
jgi:hypothetical protein